jgi:hypothetical protein
VKSVESVALLRKHKDKKRHGFHGFLGCGLLLRRVFRGFAMGFPAFWRVSFCRRIPEIVSYAS